MNYRLLWSGTNQRTPTVFWLLLMLLLVVIATGTGSAAAAEPTSVTLSSFTAETQGNTIFVRWVTETELDVYRFILYRGTSPQPVEPFVTVCEQSPQGSGISGATYTCTDDKPGLTAGHAYYYWLYEYNANGQPTVYPAGTNPTYFQGTPTATPTVPADATNTPTPTVTPTSEFTLTPTPTASVTATPIPTQAVTNTPTSVGATNTPTSPAATNTPTTPPTNTPATPPTNTPTLVPGATNTPVANATATTPATATAAVTLTPSVQGTATPTAPLPADGATATPTLDISPTDAVSATATLTSTPPTPGPTDDAALTPPVGAATRLPSRVRPDATVTPASAGVARNTAATGLLLCLGGGAIVGAGLLAVVGFVLWRRQPGGKNDPSS